MSTFFVVLSVERCQRSVVLSGVGGVGRCQRSVVLSGVNLFGGVEWWQWSMVLSGGNGRWF